MALARLLGFRTLSCGCVIGRYSELNTTRVVSYCEEKGSSCENPNHRRNYECTDVANPPTVSPS